MNKEILQKLADQAAVNDMANNFNGEDYTVRMPSETWAREFAELIIQECLKVMDQNWLDGHEVHEAMEDIKKHFGVE